MRNRPSTVAILLAVLVVTSGCVGVLTGSKALTFSAEAAKVPQSTASDVGYKLTDTTSKVITRNYSAAGQERTVKVTNKIATYEKRVDFGPLGSQRLAVFAAISTPAVEIAGQTFNPIADYNNAELVSMLSSQYESISNVRQVSSQNITVLGTETRVSKFAATATFSGAQIDVNIHVTKIRDGDDFVVLVGIYPQQKSGEQANILKLMKAVNHPTQFQSS